MIFFDKDKNMGQEKNKGSKSEPISQLETATLRKGFN